ncbi:MAG TPA: cobaltochelatase subunit CobN [Blastocatellia bacterium]
MKEGFKNDDRDRRVLELYERVLEIEQRLIPSGLHVFGRKLDGQRLADMLAAVASFERPELRLRPLPDLIAEGLGLACYATLIEESAGSEQRLVERERVEELARLAIKEFLLADASGRIESAGRLLAQSAGVPPGESARLFGFLADLLYKLEANNEIDGLSKALRGEYVEPGPGADVVQNPGILPTGRNTHAVNPYMVPSLLAMRRAEPMARAMLDRHIKESGRFPESIAMVLWGIDNIKTEGVSVAQALWLLGVMPKRDGMNRVTDIDVIPVEQLGRPRVDVVMTVSGIFRDLFGPTMGLLDMAVRRVAALDEPDDINHIRRNVRRQMNEGQYSFDEAVVRVFSNAAGNYGTNVNFMVLDSQWDKSDELGALFIKRKCFAYGRDSEGRSFDSLQSQQMLEEALSRVEVTYQNIDTAEVGIIDVDHYFEYLGGISKAIENIRGSRPHIYLSDALSPALKIRTLEETVKLETRTKTLNPKWYEGMLKHGFSGVAEIEHHVTNTFGWSATADAVDDWIYDEVAATYVLDEAMLDRLRSLNPYSARNLVGRLLEAAGRGFWEAESEVVERLREVFGNLEDELEGVMR